MTDFLFLDPPDNPRHTQLKVRLLSRPLPVLMAPSYYSFPPMSLAERSKLFKNPPRWTRIVESR
ncbi:MAG: hypothetical protein L6R40_000234 [Gallowayella cf. fulva]|nr:MAG: hypothetical protein L6R40_000234 [Xanthomendoza cf. fulva]